MVILQVRNWVRRKELEAIALSAMNLALDHSTTAQQKARIGIFRNGL
jgi:hypothetical protein